MKLIKREFVKINVLRWEQLSPYFRSLGRNSKVTSGEVAIVRSDYIDYID